MHDDLQKWCLPVLLKILFGHVKFFFERMILKIFLILFIIISYNFFKMFSFKFPIHFSISSPNDWDTNIWYLSVS